MTEKERMKRDSEELEELYKRATEVLREMKKIKVK